MGVWSRMSIGVGLISCMVASSRSEVTKAKKAKGYTKATKVKKARGQRVSSSVRCSLDGRGAAASVEQLSVGGGGEQRQVWTDVDCEGNVTCDDAQPVQSQCSTSCKVRQIEVYILNC